MTAASPDGNDRVVGVPISRLIEAERKMNASGRDALARAIDPDLYLAVKLGELLEMTSVEEVRDLKEMVRELRALPPSDEEMVSRICDALKLPTEAARAARESRRRRKTAIKTVKRSRKAVRQ